MGHKPLTTAVRNSLRRKKSIATRKYTLEGSTASVHTLLIESFSKLDFETYEYYYHKWGSPGRKRQALVDVMETRQIIGPALELAKLRVANLYEHQKVWQCIRYRWSDLYSYNQQRINSTQDAVWNKLARGVASRMQDIPRMHSPKWGSTKQEVIESLVICFKQKFETQNGLCAISQVPLAIEIGSDVENKCSIDRIDSLKPYTEKNIQLVAFWANVMKFDTPMDQFLSRVNLIYQANHTVA
jgi:hypothetical protein